ncbi:sulfotransferase [Kitasatospora sp. MAP5-34]|uniref:sulfotransferase family protein n=1 Tax=Kitasatospora sp. MAP5-34 TaxID=3035102 RepID=UPI0024732BD6|nr:sulfotransferase [Kitasatospora sp. MAP5-34]MDH6574652.1 LPS sulfotransferase NodH [Kitasatospora sp. MAP5-34]
MRRLLSSPVFLLSAPRSGSTLLRCILDSHSDICAPHELYFGELRVEAPTRQGRTALTELGLDTGEVANVTWDAMMHHLLTESGKSVFVDKTPRHLFMWRRIADAWPDARYIHLLRHPEHVLQSLREKVQQPDVYERALQYFEEMIQVRESLPGHLVRYEDLTGDPATTVRGICDFLGVPWQPAMLDYRRNREERYPRRLGDESDRIHSGVIRSALRQLPDGGTTQGLEPYCTAFGYPLVDHA